MKEDLKQCPRSGLFVPESMCKPKPNWPPQIDIPKDVRGKSASIPIEGDPFFDKHLGTGWSRDIIKPQS